MASFGEALRRERELRDISLREIADATKINLRYLEALEQNRFDILPGGVFNKGFIRAYARFIGADGETLVDLYLHEAAPRESGALVAPGAPGAPPGLLRLPEPPARRAAQATPSSGAATAARSAAAATPAVAARSAPAPPIPAATPAPRAPAAGSGSVAPPDSPQAAEPLPAPAQRSAPAPRPVAPLRVASVPQHHEPLTERAAALAAITHPPAAKEAAARRLPGSTLGIFLAAGGVVLAGAIAILVTRGLRAREGVRDLPASTAPSLAGSPETAAAAGEASLDPSGVAADGPEADAAPNDAPPPGPQTPAAETPAPLSSAAPTDGTSPSPLVAAIGAGFGVRSTARPGADPFSPLTARAHGTPIEPPPARREVPPAAAAPAIAPVESAPRPPAPPGMEFRIEATDQVWAQVSCDGEDRLNRMLQAGEGTTLRCLSSVRVSVTDGGAVRLLVNGARCGTPAEKGYEMKGFVIRVENAAAICPPGPGGPHERR